MKVELNLKEKYCKITKESGDPRFTSSGWALAESWFLHRVKQELIKQGFDVIKKRMWKDGHMVSDDQQYIRSRSGLKTPEEFAIYNENYAIYDAGEEFNRSGEMYLSVII